MGELRQTATGEPRFELSLERDESAPGTFDITVHLVPSRQRPAALQADHAPACPAQDDAARAVSERGLAATLRLARSAHEHGRQLVRASIVGVAALASRSADRIRRRIARLPMPRWLQHRPRSRASEPVELSSKTGNETTVPVRTQIELLRTLLASRQGTLVPELSASALQGHAFPLADHLFGVGPGASRRVLEELADAGLLRREPHNVIHVCPDCQRSQISFRELCAVCSSFDLELESMIHHFRCSYTGVESAFAAGFDLVCPKCHRVLNQLGQDFDRPGRVYVCRACKRVAEDPVVRVQCLHCAREFASELVEPLRIHAYHPTLLAARAVELNRLTCLDLSSVMFDARVGLATREFLNLQARREHARLERHGTPFAAAVMSFKHEGVAHPIFRNWNAHDLRQLGRSIAESTRSLDLVAQLDPARLGMLLPETDAQGLAGARARLVARLDDYVLRTPSSQALQIAWTESVWSATATPLEQVLGFFDREPDQLLDRDQDNPRGAAS